MDIRFTKFDTSSQWVNGEVNNGEYVFESKLYDEGSVFGINEGRVSKLWIRDNYNRCVVNYDRGWDIEPISSSYDRHVFEEVLEFLENSPKRFE